MIIRALIWWREAGSNCRHTDFQSVALPTELSRQWCVLNQKTHPRSSVFLIFLVNLGLWGLLFGFFGRIFWLFCV